MTNATAQSVQGARFLNYWNFGGKEAKEQERQKAAVSTPERTETV